MISLLFSCENATCAVPEAFRELFRGVEETVTSAEGWEPGALNLAQGFAMKFRTPLVHGDVTRLLIDLEKGEADCWSRFSGKLADTSRAKLLERHWKPYRATLRQRIAEDLRRHAGVVHVMVHVAGDEAGVVTLETSGDSPLAEARAAKWKERLAHPDLKVIHRTAPLSSLGDELAADFPSASYGQIALQVAPSFFLEGKPWRWETLKKRLLESLAEAQAQ